MTSRTPAWEARTKLRYFSEGDRAIDTVDVIAHESFHRFAATKNVRATDGTLTSGQDKIYLGDRKAVTVKFTPVFYSSEMVPSIPKRCRSTTYGYGSGDRFAAYIVDEPGMMDSNRDGVYGLLNEFTGYCWGLNATNRTFAYRDRFADDPNTWETFYVDGENDRLAYMQFKYYILHYMLYARQHHPAVYRKLVANDALRKAYRLIDKRFGDEVAEYEKLLKQRPPRTAAQSTRTACRSARSTTC